MVVSAIILILLYYSTCQSVYWSLVLGPTILVVLLPCYLPTSHHSYHTEGTEDHSCQTEVTEDHSCHTEVTEDHSYHTEVTEDHSYHTEVTEDHSYHTEVTEELVLST